jgi:hypothetical protein
MATYQVILCLINIAQFSSTWIPWLWGWGIGWLNMACFHTSSHILMPQPKLLDKTQWFRGLHSSLSVHNILLISMLFWVMKIISKLKHHLLYDTIYKLMTSERQMSSNKYLCTNFATTRYIHRFWHHNQIRPSHHCKFWQSLKDRSGAFAPVPDSLHSDDPLAMFLPGPILLRHH